MKKQGKTQEILEELRMVLTGKNKILDAVLPPLVFVLVNAWQGLFPALAGAMAVAGVFAAVRLIKRQQLSYALGGLGAVLLASLFAFVLNRAQGFFLPGILSGGLTVLACLLSVIVGRPLVALTSFVARRWPLKWYWHPRVRPAYSEVTLAWGIFFLIRLVIQYSLFQNQSVETLTLANLLLGWPATILLLVISYIYGTWRIHNLAGPSVEEFKSGTPPPWQSQLRGF